MSNEKDEKKEIEVVSGDGSNLDISPVYEHIEAVKPKHREKKPKDIVVPGQKKEDSKN
jgi:hypothetical protein